MVGELVTHPHKHEMRAESIAERGHSVKRSTKYEASRAIQKTTNKNTSKGFASPHPTAPHPAPFPTHSTFILAATPDREQLRLSISL